MASDYSQGKIYKLTAGDLTYYGSTTITLNKRFTQHEQDAKNNNNRASQKLFETGEKNWCNIKTDQFSGWVDKNNIWGNAN